MNFNDHSRLVGQHAFLSASNYHWINYDDSKLDARWVTAMAARRGSEMHELAANLIRLGVKLPKTPTTINLYVNDAIGYRMRPEQVLYYSDNAFGTADAIGYRAGKLRIYDLKTGTATTSIHQLEVYAALFCLEYRFKPHELEMDFRIYQSDEVRMYEGDPVVVAYIMDKMITFDKRINALREEER